jgi:hypothetical protein
MLQLQYEPRRLAERIGDALGVMTRRVEGDLARFKRFVEEQGWDKAGWRGEIPAKPDAAQQVRRATATPQGDEPEAGEALR